MRFCTSISPLPSGCLSLFASRALGQASKRVMPHTAAATPDGGTRRHVVSSLQSVMSLCLLVLCLTALGGCATRQVAQEGLHLTGDGDRYAVLHIVPPMEGTDLPAAYVLGMTFPTSAFSRHGLDEAVVQSLRESDRVSFVVGFELEDAQGAYVREFYPQMSCTVGERMSRCVAAGLFDGVAAERVLQAATFKLIR